MKTGRIKTTLLLTGILLLNIPASAGRYDYTGSWVLKLNTLGLTTTDIGFGFGAEYRFHHFLSFQLEAGYAAYGHEDLAIRSLNAYSLRPELRIYLPHPSARKGPRADMYAGLEFTLKHAGTHFAGWHQLEDDQGNSYQQFSDYKTRNFTFGPIFRFGFQAYFLPSRNLVADIGFGIGPSFNQVSFRGDPPPGFSSDQEWDDVFSFNKYSGIYAHAQFDLRIGYRF